MNIHSYLHDCMCENSAFLGGHLPPVLLITVHYHSVTRGTAEDAAETAFASFQTEKFA